MEQEAQGFNYVDEASMACQGCVAEPGFKQWIAQQGTHERFCTCCWQISRPVRVNSLFGHINEWLSNWYDEAVDSLPYDSGEGGYQDTVFDSTDLSYDLFENEELQQLFIHSFIDRQFCAKLTDG